MAAASFAKLSAAQCMKISDLADDPDAVRPRLIEDALADLVAKYAWRPSAELARMIEQLQAEIVDRKRPD
jgi:predicted transcriptional regulator